MSYHYLFDIALILLSTKLFGLLTRRIQLPQVVGALIAGILLGPAVLNILHETEFIVRISELGVIVLMFTAGLDTDIRELKKTGAASFVIAMCGVLIPLAGGFLVAFLFNKGGLSQANANLFLQNVFIGIVLTATSVSITVETLKELGRLTTKAGNAILGAALIDDVLGIIGLTIVTSLAGQEVNLFLILLKIALFFLLSGVVGFISYKLFRYWMSQANKNQKRYVIVAFAFCLLFSYVAERYFGVADITGAYLAGLIISNTQRTKYIASRFEILSYMLLSPVFFASIGIKFELVSMSNAILWFTLLLVAVAVLTKIIGCGFGARVCGFSGRESLQIGTGMISRGEVALITANKGAAAGLMNPVFFGPLILVVIVTTVITPILLKFVFKGAKSAEALVQSDLVERYEESHDLDLATQALLDQHYNMRDGKIDPEGRILPKK